MIDWTQVEVLKSELGEDAFEEVVALFLDEMSAEIDGLAQETDAARLEARFHILKGSALNLGFAEFSDLCGTAEAATAGGAPDFGSITKIMTIYDASRAVFLSGLSNRKAG
ncbi:MAG: Hpt domain-containing protein [Rhodobacteraceae bacterium]|jgi:HPt (histidine-containing phosphotransfer) domain-containing protein|nr:Hpt domain-containing protein [Paracoccaceae bacterium]